MFSKATRTLATATGHVRTMSSGRAFNVAVLGAGGGIGQPLSLLMKQSGMVEHLRLFDIVNTAGIAADISHCSTAGTVSGHAGDAQLPDALDGADVVLISAGVPRKPGMTRDDLFNTNAGIVQALAKQVAKSCPEAHVLMISNPLNSIVPIVAETLKAGGLYLPHHLYGVTMLDVVRANQFVGTALGRKPEDTRVDVIGGHAGTTILPLLSRVEGIEALDQDTIAALSHRIQFGGDEVVKAKDGAGSATLSMAYAGAKMAVQLMRALNGEKGITECAFVESDAVDGCRFFATPVELGEDGVEKIHGVGELNAFEQENFDAMVPDLIGQIEKGVEFAAK